MQLRKATPMKETHIFAELLEPQALEQFNSAMEQPFSIQGALMPDAHSGYSLPIGAVIATEQVIVPAWVGYDIGCGMCAIPTNFDKHLVELNAQVIFEKLYKAIPVGFAHNQKPSAWKTIPRCTEVLQSIFRKNGLNQLGSLGGGNHFIEVGYDEEETIWVIVHSGSRNLGHQTATHYMKLASPDSKAREGHFGFDINSSEGRDYILDLNFCLQFALENRLQILQRALVTIASTIMHPESDELGGYWDALINRNHNHAEIKDSLVIHRKGATHAEVGMAGVIPGNMRDGSFIVRGKGNPDSLCSSSHGAGRVLGRKAAQRELTLEQFTSSMQGVTAKVNQETLDESPFAYKNIFEVMEQQKDLVSIIHHIRPIINIKG